jgi:hypothetical protein
LEVAVDYLANDQLSECGNRLRKCAEANLESFLRAARAKQGLDSLFSTDKFSSLGNSLAQAKNLLALSAQAEFAQLLQQQFTPDELAMMFSPDEIDPTKFVVADKKEKGRIIGRLMAGKSIVQRLIVEMISDASRKRLNAIKLLDDVKNIKDRILNPASHAGVTPIYTKEAEDAVKVIQALESAMVVALATL